MTVHGEARVVTWFLRALLVLAAGVLLTVLGSSGAWAQDEPAPVAAAPFETGPFEVAAATTASDEGTPVDDVASVAAATEPETSPVADLLTPVDPVADVPMAEPEPAAADETTPAAADEVTSEVPAEEQPAEVSELLPEQEVLAPVVSAPATDVRVEKVADPAALALAAAVDRVELATVPPPTAPRWAPEPRRMMRAIPAPSVEPVAAAPHTPCPSLPAPLVATARTVSPVSPEHGPDDRAPLPDDPAPVAAAPPTVEHLRSGSGRPDGPGPSGGPAVDLPSSGSTLSSGRTRTDGDLPAGVEPPQLRVLSTRAGPVPAAVPAVAIEILDSHA